MAKRFKLRISRVFPSFQSCRSKDLPENPLTPVFRISTFNTKPFHLDFPAPPPPTPPPSSSLKRHVLSVGCGCRSKNHHPIIPTHPPPTPSPTTDFHWRKEEKWHVVARISNHRRRNSSGDSSDDTFPTATRKKKNNKNRNNPKKLKKKKNHHRTRARISTSSADHSGWFSSDDVEDNDDRNEYNDDEDDDMETLVSSSRTFSANSTPVQERKPKKGSYKKRGKTVRRNRRGGVEEEVEKVVPCPSPETDAPARVSVFRRMMSWGAEGKVRESVAVVKRSEDPYGDFKRSMVEMILEKEMYGEDDLEQLLQCFLSLNSRAHHGVIVEAFSEIWEALFCKTPRPGKGKGGGTGSGISKASALSSLI